MSKIAKARFWTGVLYPENMREDWEVLIGDIVQYPYAYCVHNRDKDSKSEHRKDHVHIILAFPNTTTYKHAMSVFGLLSATGKKALNKCEAVVGIRNVYDYLIHDTEACRKQGKEQYASSERITGNNFDIGAYEQLSTAEKNEMFMELGQAIIENGFSNYMDFYEYVVNTYANDMNYIAVFRCYSGHFERMTRGNYLRFTECFSPSQGQGSTNTTIKTPKTPQICCPKCGSVEVIKHGKTPAQSQRWLCKDCGKRFV